jgi:anti-sigma B factor antagonist
VDFNVDDRLHGDLAIVTVTGDIDVFTSPHLRETLLDLIEGGGLHLLVDLSAVEFLDSTGLGVLVGIFHRLRSRDGSMAFVSTDDRVRRIFHVTQLTKIFTIYASMDEALQAHAADSHATP